MNLARQICLISLVAFTLSGCLLVSPYHVQTLTSRTQAIPFQAWSASNSVMLRVECIPTSRFGPTVSTYGSWTEIDTIEASDKASLDLSGAKMYSAAKNLSLPERCWYLNTSNSWYYTSLRISEIVEGPATYFHTLERDGIRCVAETVADKGYWLAWLTNSGDRCALYWDNGSAISVITVRSNS